MTLLQMCSLDIFFDQLKQYYMIGKPLSMKKWQAYGSSNRLLMKWWWPGIYMIMILMKLTNYNENVIK